MRVKLNPELSPRPVSELPPELAKHVVHHAMLKVTPKSRLRLMLVVVDKPRWIGKVADFLADAGHVTGPCEGVVYPLSCDVESYKHGPEPRMSRDVAPGVFSLMVLSKERLTMEYIAHEVTHAAINFARRVPRHKLPWADRAAYDNGNEDDDEALAYPAGRIGSEVVKSLERGGL